MMNLKRNVRGIFDIDEMMNVVHNDNVDMMYVMDVLMKRCSKWWNCLQNNRNLHHHCVYCFVLDWIDRISSMNKNGVFSNPLEVNERNENREVVVVLNVE